MTGEELELEGDPLRAARGVAVGCLISLLAWALIAGGIVLLCVAAILAWG